MLRTRVDFGISMGFFFILGVSYASTGYPETADSTQVIPGQSINSFHQLIAASSYPLSLSSQTFSSSSLSQSASSPAIANVPNTDVSSRVQSGAFNNDFINSFQPSFVSMDSSSVSSASSTKNTVSASTGTSSAIGNIDEVSANTCLPIEALAQTLSQSLSSIPAVRTFLNVPIPVSEISNTLYTSTFKLLSDYGYSDPHRIASIVSQPVKLFGVFTLPLLFDVISKSIATLLLNEGVEIHPNISQVFASFNEKSIKSYNVSNVDSLIEAIWYGSVNFLTSLGINILEKTEALTQSYSEELNALENKNIFL